MAEQIRFDLSVENEEPMQLLPCDGEVFYFGPIFEREAADGYLKSLLNNIQWRQDEVFLYGRRIQTARKVAWSGDQDFDYTYSGQTKTAIPWNEDLLAIKLEVERRAGVNYNSCLLNLYADGSQGMSWHSDDEPELGDNPNIASVSFGADRRFDFRHKDSKENVSVGLDHGGLLVMKGRTQKYWQHQLPKTKKVSLPRVNLTFRRMGKG